MFFHGWVERRETGKAWDLLCKNKQTKEMFLEKYILLFDTSLYFLVGFHFCFPPPESILESWL